MIFCYGQDWFFNFDFFGVNLRELFQMHPINLSVAIWVGFLALFGIASDDGVVMCTYLEQSFKKVSAENIVRSNFLATSSTLAIAERNATLR